MFTPTTGWAAGARRTTDGGADWTNVSPASVKLRSSAYAEFFLGRRPRLGGAGGRKRNRMRGPVGCFQHSRRRSHLAARSTCDPHDPFRLVGVHRLS